jgi:hypothetical protein
MLVSSAFLEAARPGEFAAFLDDEARDALSRFVRARPFAGQAHGLELKLSSAANDADYALCLRAEDAVASVRAVLRGQGSTGEVSGAVRAFLERWSDDVATLRRQFPLLWLEWDRPTAADAGVPGLFVAPEPDLESAALTGVLRTLYQETEAERKARELERVLRALPPRCGVRQLGVMPSRDPSFMRLVIEGLERQTILSFLEALEWPGDVAVLSAALESVQAASGSFPTLLDLDYVHGIQPSLGLEFLLVGPKRPHDGGDALITHFVRQKLCSPEKRAALVPWLAWRVIESKAMAPRAYWQKLYHLKLSLKPRQEHAAGAVGNGTRLEAKAYLGVWSGPKEQAILNVQSALLRNRRQATP